MIGSLLGVVLLTPDHLVRRSGVRVVQLKTAGMDHQGRDSLQISHKITFLILCIGYLLQSKKLSQNLVVSNIYYLRVSVGWEFGSD